MKKVLVALVVIIVPMLLVSPVAALSFGISPSNVVLEVPVGSYDEATFIVSDFEGEVAIHLEGIPLAFEPITADVSGSCNEITVRMYGDATLGNQVFNGKICFLAIEGTVGTGLKVVTVIYHGTNHSNQVEVTTTVLQPSGSYHWIGGGGSYTLPTISDDTQPDTTQADIVPPADETPTAIESPSEDEASTLVPPATDDGTLPWYSYVNWYLMVVICGGIGLLGFGVYIWRDERKRKKS